MSNPTAHKTFALYYTQVEDFLQAVQDASASLPLVVHMESLSPSASGWQTWEVLLTALTGTTIHAARIVVGQAQEVMQTPYQQQRLETRQQQIYGLLAASIIQRGFVVRPGSYLPMRQSAELPADVLASIEGGQE